MKKRLLLVVLSFCVFNVKSANCNGSSRPVLGITSPRQRRKKNVISQPEKTHESLAEVRRKACMRACSTEKTPSILVTHKSREGSQPYLVPFSQSVASEYDTAVYMSKPSGQPKLRAATNQSLSNGQTNDNSGYLVPVPFSQSVASEYDTAVYMSKPPGQQKLRAATNQSLSNGQTNDNSDYLVPVPINKKNFIYSNSEIKEDEPIFDDLKKMIDEECDLKI